ncbi:MAG TPA: hypothetical protein VIF62_11455 [Labilithrix sp.]|jgi:hypothetical protein
MRALVPIVFVLFFGSGCVDASYPDKVNLAPEAQTVEVVTDPPNPEVYEPVGEVAATIIGREVGEAFRQAFNELRNQAAKKGATFVAVEDVQSRAAWDFSGRTVVSLVGTAYRPK